MILQCPECDKVKKYMDWVVLTGEEKPVVAIVRRFKETKYVEQGA